MSENNSELARQEGEQEKTEAVEDRQRVRSQKEILLSDLDLSNESDD